MTEQGKAEDEGAEEEVWDQPVVGDQPDGWTKDALNLAHKAVAKFPELRRRYRRFAGPAAVVSTGIVLLAGMAITRRLRRGETPDEILEELTSEEIENAAGLDKEEEEG